ncbi:MAG: hypothetical protein E7419_02665 [Ruminococcaceae bacterium]|nr:hypothetical protein [Oscillospiraceae bacterium]
MNVSFIGIIIILIIAFFVIRGLRIGLVKAIFDLLSFFIVGILTWFLYPTVSKFLISTSLYDIIHNWLSSTLQNNNLLFTSIPEFLSELPSFLKESIVVSSKNAIDNLLSTATDALAVLTVNVISIIILFIGLSILAFFVRKLGTFINKIIIIGPINMILGAFFGFVQGIFICYLIIMVISYFPTTKIYDFVGKDMEKSYICKIMYNENVDILGFKPTYPIIRGDFK